MNQTVFKRTFDVLLVSSALVFLLPVLLLLVWLVRAKLGSPILFTQTRPGKGGVPFMMYKFRSMTDERDHKGDLLPDKDRLTAFGKLLRASSLDELPGLLNVLKGDMSLVGPRPLLMEYLPLYSTEQSRRHEVRPGITGWAQVNGRNAISWEDKFRLDIWYVDNQSFWLDMKILFMTVLKVIRGSDISQDGHATMEKFAGSNIQNGLNL
ncbi:MAG: sugar transferase [Gallionella sp.]|nr:sugar transferase [Gallionella sp.]